MQLASLGSATKKVQFAVADSMLAVQYLVVFVGMKLLLVQCNSQDFKGP